MSNPERNITEKTRDAAVVMQDTIFEKVVPRLSHVAAEVIGAVPASALPVVGYGFDVPDLVPDVVSMSLAGIEIDASSFSRDGFETRMSHWLETLEIIQRRVDCDATASSARHFVVTGSAATFPMHVASSSEGSMIRVFARGRQEAAMKAVLAAHGPLTLRGMLAGDRSAINETMVVSDTAGGNVNDILGPMTGDGSESMGSVVADLPGLAPWKTRERGVSGSPT